MQRECLLQFLGRGSNLLYCFFMGREYTIKDQQDVHFVTFTVANWGDLFIRAEDRQIIKGATRQLKVHAYFFLLFYF